ncbi:hypothetical protein [Rhizobium aegyptiacum]|uniref:hypothetical protein n=1 Tax=Rhizobium aegyptiacum TaxID=1764550 RepID=UPI0007E59AF5|nr:hypothetical protein [Rhizobium aegyptiacum]
MRSPEAATDTSGIEHTKTYLLAFEEEILKASDATALKAAMDARSPRARHERRPDIGSKIAKDKMEWG